MPHGGSTHASIVVAGSSRVEDSAATRGNEGTEPICFRCRCGAYLCAANEYAGTRRGCPVCQATVIVPLVECRSDTAEQPRRAVPPFSRSKQDVAHSRVKGPSLALILLASISIFWCAVSLLIGLLDLRGSLQHAVRPAHHVRAVGCQSGAESHARGNS